MSTIAEAALYEIIKVISDNNIVNLEKYLDTLDIENIKNNSVWDLLHILMVTAMNYNSPDTVSFLLNHWSSHHPSLYEYPELYSVLFTDMRYTTSELKFIVSSLQGVSYLEVLDDLIHMDASPQTEMASEMR